MSTCAKSGGDPRSGERRRRRGCAPWRAVVAPDDHHADRAGERSPERYSACEGPRDRCGSESSDANGLEGPSRVSSDRVHRACLSIRIETSSENTRENPATGSDGPTRTRTRDLPCSISAT